MKDDSLWKPFIIPEEFLTTPILPSCSTILLLPPEILIKIFDYADQLDKVCLAFTCKYLLRISTAVCVKTLSPTQHRAAYSCRKAEEFLRRVKPLNSRGQPKKSWAICIDCVRYRPTRKSYWKSKQKEWAPAEIWANRVECWNERQLLQCPECWCEELRLAFKIPLP